MTGAAAPALTIAALFRTPGHWVPRSMLIVRWIVLLLLAAAALSFAMYVGTRQLRYRIAAVRILRWAVIGGLAVFAVLILERMAVLL